MRKLKGASLSEEQVSFNWVKEGRVKTAMDTWTYEDDRPGQRDAGFFKLARDLKFTSCDDAELADHLSHAAVCSRGDRSKMKGSIPRTLRKLE
jgi:hypothetical protein